MERLKDVVAITVLVILITSLIILSVIIPEAGLAMSLAVGIMVLSLIVSWAVIRVLEIMGL